jgi:hypothetical protein
MDRDVMILIPKLSINQIMAFDIIYEANSSRICSDSLQKSCETGRGWNHSVCYQKLNQLNIFVSFIQSKL